jgi:RluA family pseudouridine synthase
MMMTTCDVLHEDRWLILVHKPPGVLSHPNPKGNQEKCAFEGDYDFEEKCFATPAGKVWLIHRLDQDTSGVLLAAKDAKSAEACRRAFSEHGVRKTYLALTAGGGLPKKGEWHDHLAVRHQRKQVRTEVIKTALPNAESHFRLVNYDPVHRLSLLEIDLITGKTHQIRVQCASRHHPIVGDDVYGDFELNRKLRKALGIKRLCLHAARLEMKHPVTGETLRVEAAVPAEMASLLPK